MPCPGCGRPPQPEQPLASLSRHARCPAGADMGAVSVLGPRWHAAGAAVLSAAQLIPTRPRGHSPVQQERCAWASSVTAARRLWQPRHGALPPGAGVPDACMGPELPESWADMQEPLLEGMCFTLKYLGMTLVEKPKGEDMAAAAIRRIVATARVGARKFQKVILTVSPRGISLQDADTKEMVENISIYRISYCTTDKLQNKVFAYVAQSQHSGALECHAFLSPKKKIAQAVTLTVAQAFQMALDLWEAAHAGSRQEQPLHPSCALESSEPGRPSEPAPPGSPPFRNQFGEEEEEEEDNISETLSGMEELGRGAHSAAESALLVPRASSPMAQLLCHRLGQPPDSWKGPGGAGGLPTAGPRTAGPRTPLG
ncbi:carboxyl-terminal PDZ ligand of neuronal nitric oxide synthase protein isoform X2 [Columba livia]|uniref:carboxyl-terminal PDZ ligand of neuronal nitric oxide synthase protein isoform X2 n=1 Tax=Columba livia TaxID=8932 RepID=UPI0031BBCCD5